MKKLLAVMSFISIAFIMALVTLYLIDNIRMSNSKPVLFSTWGKDYAARTAITPKEAIECVNKKLDNKNKETITNLDSPKIEELVLKKQPSIYYFYDKVNLVGKCVYKITFNTSQDGLLGPIVFYVDKYSGELIGMDFRE